MIGQRLCRGVFGGREFFERCFERLAVRVGRLSVERGGEHLDPRSVCHGKQRRQGLGSGILCNAQFIIGPVFIQLSLAQLEVACTQILSKLGAADDVAQSLEQIAPEHQPLGWVGLLPEHVDIQLPAVGRFSIGGHRANLGQKRLGNRGIQIGPACFGQGCVELLGGCLKGTRILLVHFGCSRPRFEGLKTSLIFLPRTVVIHGQHCDRGEQQQDRRHAKDNVQHLQIAPSLFGGRHWECGSEIQRKFGDTHDVFEIQRPAKNHFQWQ